MKTIAFYMCTPCKDAIFSNYNPVSCTVVGCGVTFDFKDNIIRLEKL